MGNAQQGNSNDATSKDTVVAVEGKKKKAKCPMCVCKNERAARDMCIVENGEEACKEYIDALNACLKKEGFGEFKKAS